MAWSDAARAAAAEARRRKRSLRQESRYFKIDRWYDRSTRSWVVTPRFKATGYDTGLPSVYVHQKSSAKNTGLGHFDLASALRQAKGGFSDPRGGKFVQKRKGFVMLKRKR